MLDFTRSTHLVLASLALLASPCASACKRSRSDAPDPSQTPPLSTQAGSLPSSPAPVDSAGTPMYEEGADLPVVTLDGQYHPLKSAPGSGPKRIGAVSRQSPIHHAPSPQSRVLGYLRAGGVVDVAEGPAGKDGCPGGWFRIAPFGFVCNGPTATLDMKHEVLQALSRRPDLQASLPFMYGIVRKPGPIYSRIPSREQANAAETNLESHVAKWLKATDENGAAFRPDYWLRWKDAASVPSAADAWSRNTTDPLPPFLQIGRLLPGNISGLVKDKDPLTLGIARRRNGFAIVDTVLAEGRRYAVTSELVVLPVDRLRPIEGSRSHGFRIPEEIDFPFAIIRVDDVWGYKYEKGKLSKGKQLPRRSAVKLTGKQNFFNGRLHYETVDNLWVSDRDASRLDPAKRMPAWGKNGERWMDINITKQTLVAFEGTKAVYATLVSTGEAGLGDPEKTRSTKRGIFRVHTKHLTATMNSDVTGEEFELQDIPYVQYFEGGYALHAAYWHDDFGKPRSHGCINLAPEDARRLFFWTEPKVPPGWHTVLRPLTGSVLFVHP